ncbi:acyltransferase family protein [Sinorhizobium sp. BG8]|uniref:acyltransferase family protein n=1 Tax=Sinorhizobium sp. BG8 TaxID=2613773 RepID=UPI00193EAD56|nr:acyltransferase family protein [Sinorhizobium sp. BG8]QRM54978.1 acyltransferase [Sinorhizobium sp. BG8]
MQYRNEIDGLRAVAVVSVVFFHAGFSFWGGGFAGVDVFFVISGYLITSLILRDLDSGTFSLVSFYERRARRILPALVLVMLCCMPFAWRWMLPAAFIDYSKSLITAALSVSNFYFWHKSDYFAPDSHEVPLLHTWSLGVEEQFYVLLPLLLMGLWKTRRSWVTWTILAIAAASLGLSQWGAQNAPDANFYLLPARAWELLAGSLVALMQFRREGVAPHRAAGQFALLGLALVLFSIFFFDETVPFPSVYALVPVVGTALILQFAVKGTWAATLLSAAPLVVIGQLSYSAYLWHQPLFAFARLSSLSVPSTAFMLALCGLTFVLAYLSWRFVERPFRKGSVPIFANTRQVFTTSAVSLFALISFGLVGVYTDGMRSRLPEPVKNFLADTSWSRKCLFQRGDARSNSAVRDCVFNAEQAKHYAIWGDSVSASIAPELARRLKEDGIALHQLTHGYCAPILDVTARDVAGARDCPDFNREAYNLIIRSGISTVILFASWEEFFDRGTYLVEGVATDEKPAGMKRLKDELRETVDGLERAGVKVVLVYPHPTLRVRAADTAAKLMLKGDAKPEVGQSYQEFLGEAAKSYAVLDSADIDGPTRIYPERLFCNRFEAGQCVMVNEGMPYLVDSVHFAAEGAKVVADAIMKMLEAPSQQDKESKGLGFAS